MAFTVLHTADWHLGVRLRELDREAEYTAFLAWLIGVAENEAADLLVVAGDVFESANPPQSAFKMWYDFLAALRQRCPQCAVVAVAGNHDSPHVLESASAVLAGMGVFIIGEMPEDAARCVRVYTDKSGKPALALAAVPFLRDRDLRSGSVDFSAETIQTHLREGIRACYDAAGAALAAHRSAGLAIMATGHLTVAGGSVSESERDIHVGNLGAVSAEIFGTGFDYVALGHLHRPQRAGSDAVRYSGSPVALSFSEWKDVKEIRVLTFENGALKATRGLPVPVTRPLLRVQASVEMLEAEILMMPLPESPLPAWLEVTVSPTAEPAAVLAECIRKALTGRRAELLALRRTGAATGTASAASAELHELKPAEVFESLLNAGPLPGAERASLRLTFSQLLDQHSAA